MSGTLHNFRTQNPSCVYSIWLLQKCRFVCPLLGLLSSGVGHWGSDWRILVFPACTCSVFDATWTFPIYVSLTKLLSRYKWRELTVPWPDVNRMIKRKGTGPPSTLKQPTCVAVLSLPLQHRVRHDTAGHEFTYSATPDFRTRLPFGKEKLHCLVLQHISCFLERGSHLWDRLLL